MNALWDVLDLITLMSPFHLEIFYDSMTFHLEKSCYQKWYSSVVLQFGPVQLMPSFATAVHQTLFVKLTPYIDLFASQAMQKTSALLRNASQVNYH